MNLLEVLEEKFDRIEVRSSNLYYYNIALSAIKGDIVITASGDDFDDALRALAMHVINHSDLSAQAPGD